MRRYVGRLLSATILLAVGCAAAFAQGGPREVEALVGAGQDTVTSNVYFPNVLHVQVGDVVTWRLNSDEIHTVSFIEDVPADQLRFAAEGPQGPILNPMIAFPTRPPGSPVETYTGTGFASSGIMSHEPPGPDAPANDTFSLTFDTPGTWTYYCLIHEEFMVGTITVSPQGSPDVPTPEQVAEQAQTELEPLLANLEATRDLVQEARSEPGPADTQLLFVHAGMLDVVTPDPRGELLEFLPNDVTVTSGDTVVWGSTGFHTVSFVPVPPSPLFITPEPQAEGPPLLHVNVDVLTPAKPEAVYDPMQYFNSGDIGFFSTNGASWALTFEEPGIYEYVCLIHEALGMRGTVTVLPR